LQRIRQSKASIGIQGLLSVAQRNPATLASSDLGFAVGPRLNAAGRLDDMSIGIECLLSEDKDHALSLATQLDELNRERRQVEQSMQQDALAIVEKLALDQAAPPAIYVLHDDTWHQGVVGLVASRVKERTARPVLALAPSDKDGEWKGSARSVQGIHIRDLLARVDALHPNLMAKFGGHAMAAGLSLQENNLAKFSQILQQVAHEMTAGQDWSQVVWTDGSLSADHFDLGLAEELRNSTPWGQGFEEPIFEGVFEVVDARVVGDTHAKLKLLPDGSRQPLDAICFGYLDTHEQLPKGVIQAVFRLDVNEFRQRTNLQLLVQHINLQAW